MRVAISAVRKKTTRLNRYELIEKIQSKGHEVFYIGQECNGKKHKDYQKYNIEFLSIPLVRKNTNPFSEIKTILKTNKVLSDEKIEAMIAYGIRTFPTMVLSARLAGVKKILCIVNGSGRLFKLNGIKGFLVKTLSYPMLWLSFTLANNVLFQNTDDLKLVKKKGLLWRKNYDVINGSGVNLEDYKFFNLVKKPIFTMIGRITGSKGVNEYILAAKIVKEYYPDAVFNLIGPMDNDDSSLSKKDLDNAITNGIIQLNDEVEDVRPYIKRCRFFVLPSYHEGTPRTVLEAMAMGRPIITTDAPGCRETVIEGVNGFKVPIKETKYLAEKMIWMIENPEKVEEMGKESRRICEEKYDIHDVNTNIVDTIGL